MRWRWRLNYPVETEWAETEDRYKAVGMFMDGDYDVEPIDDEASLDQWGRPLKDQS